MNTNEIRERLVSRRDEIINIVNKVGKHVGHRDEALDRDSGERAIELENLDALFAIDSETRLELRQINNAISRIDAGDYGLCNQCGKAIEERRLSTLPHIDVCVSCADRAEAKKSF